MTPADGTTDREYSLEQQRRFWNDWNTRAREGLPLGDASLARQDFVLSSLTSVIKGSPIRILEIGCGTGWLSKELAAYGTVTAVDLAGEVIDRARSAVPEVNFVAGDFFAISLPAHGFDAVVSLETLSHVADQPSFFQRASELLAPGGVLILTTQNRFVMERIQVMAQGEGQVRHWLTRGEVRRMAKRHFDILVLQTIAPQYGRGVLRIGNSVKLVNFLGRVLGPGRVRRYQERIGLGQTIVLLGRSRAT